LEISYIGTLLGFKILDMLSKCKKFGAIIVVIQTKLDMKIRDKKNRLFNGIIDIIPSTIDTMVKYIFESGSKLTP